MDPDIRGGAAFRVTEEFFRRWLEPGSGLLSTAVEPSIRPDGRAVALSGTVYERLDGVGHARVAIADERGLRLVTSGPGSDRCPRWSPEGRMLAFLSDRVEQGVFALYLLRDGLGEAMPTSLVDGTVEYCSWSPDGRHVLLGVAGRGADLAGGQGSGTTATMSDGSPAWLPEVTAPAAAHEWRSVWIYDFAADNVRQVSPEGTNVWEATWLGPDRIVAAASVKDPSENAWYTANLITFELGDDSSQVVYKPQDQLGWPTGSPDGRRVAVVEAVCSDRRIVAGDVRVVDTETGGVDHVDTGGVDVTGLQWITEQRLGYVGIRGLETVVGWYDIDTGIRTELLGREGQSGYRYPEATFAGDGTAALLFETYHHPPVVTLVSPNGTEELASLANTGTDWLRSVAGTATSLTWQAPDGIDIHGILCTPAGDGPFPLVVLVHGGPVWSFRSQWTMRYDHTPLLVSRGYAVLHPNPRGSSGRGQDFARAVVGDMGGADTHDILAGIDILVERGLADPGRIGVMGGSYGGFMSSWIITQDQRFAAAVPMSPTTDWYSQHYGSNIGVFDTLFLGESPNTEGGKHCYRSPVLHAGKARTPTLLIAGARDRCTPPGQAVEFHHALREHGIESELVIYPQEGHGVQALPARIDLATRVVDWFERHMPPPS